MKNRLCTKFLGLALCSVVMQVQASSTIKDFISSGSRDIAYFNCAYKGKKASKKCLVSHSFIKSNTHPELKKFYGPNETLTSINIKWPDGDISRYAYVDSMDMFNLNSKNGWGYRIRDKDDMDGWDIDFSRGFIIDGSPHGENLIRLW